MGRPLIAAGSVAFSSFLCFALFAFSAGDSREVIGDSLASDRAVGHTYSTKSKPSFAHDSRIPSEEPTYHSSRHSAPIHASSSLYGSSPPVYVSSNGPVYVSGPGPIYTSNAGSDLYSSRSYVPYGEGEYGVGRYYGRATPEYGSYGTPPYGYGSKYGRTSSESGYGPFGVGLFGLGHAANTYGPGAALSGFLFGGKK
ncbi:hypothetical protein DdX_15561 [Ditylenchus destructor]|uniref:Uncharacterized protein n=1 Tax=Ditylenchus destructor TaxID=166010 RepID=A0AAD4MS00_9BILA|nr:hypothetical protein DdX_15561 [Ditylenchus destructor]